MSQKMAFNLVPKVVLMFAFDVGNLDKCWYKLAVTY